MNAKRLILVGAAAGALSCTGVAWAWRRFGPATYVRARTMFGKTRVYQVEDDAGNAVRLLEVGGIVQSGTYVDDRYAELVFEYLKLYDLMFARTQPIRRVCVLGCGGYDYPEHLVAAHADVAVDAVEVDPAITDLARRYFFLDRIIAEYDAVNSGRLNLVCADALAHLQAPGPRYDAIVNDTFDAGTPPAHLTTPAFARAVHGRLEQGGMYLTNIVSPLEGRHATFLHEQVGILGGVFANVRVYPCHGGAIDEDDNVVVAASDDPLPETAPQMGYHGASENELEGHP